MPPQSGGRSKDDPRAHAAEDPQMQHVRAGRPSIARPGRWPGRHRLVSQP